MRPQHLKKMHEYQIPSVRSEKSIGTYTQNLNINDG